MESGLRLMVFDRTAWGLGTIWAAGARLYRYRSLLDANLGASSWQEALNFIADFRPEQPIAGDSILGARQMG